MKISLKTLALFALAVGLLVGVNGCSPGYPNCHGDDHCQSDGRSEYCVAGICKQCRDDSHCNQTNPCMECAGDRTCQKKYKCCMSDLECPGEKCWKLDPNPARPGECGDVCLHVKCPEGQKCSGGACVPDLTCVDDAGCPPGHKCLNGRCKKADCEIQTIYFDYNEGAIRLDQEAVLSANAECLKRRQAAHRVEGHCDERGDGEYNLALGQRRANAVKRQYEALGVDRSLLSTLSYGKERTVCSTSGEECWRQNRRVETTQQ